MSTRFIIDLEDMDEISSGSLGLWLEMIIREETEHNVEKLRIAKPRKITQVEGVDYSAEGIEALRQELIGFRGESMKQWPEAIPVTVCLTHTIALLAYLIELVPVVA